MVESHPVLHFGVAQIQRCILIMSTAIDNPSGFLVSDMNGRRQLETIACIDFSQDTAIFCEGIDTEASGLKNTGRQSSLPAHLHQLQKTNEPDV